MYMCACLLSFLFQNIRVEVSANERGLLAFFLAKIAKIDPDLIIVSNTHVYTQIHTKLHLHTVDSGISLPVKFILLIVCTNDFLWNFMYAVTSTCICISQDVLVCDIDF